MPSHAAVRWFLSDVAEVAGYAAKRDPDEDMSSYVARRPVLTVRDPWFFAALVALESTKICDLFEPEEAGALMREISAQIDGTVGRSGDKLSALLFALLGRLGYGAIIMHQKVPDSKISEVILLMLGGFRDWSNLIPDSYSFKQVRRALGLGAPSWWRDYGRGNADQKRSDDPPDTDLMEDDFIADDSILPLPQWPAAIRAPEPAL